MITNDKKDYLAQVSGLGEKRRVEKIRSGVKEKYVLEDELALIRKEIVRIAERGAEYTTSPEFKEYNEYVETVKTNSVSQGGQS